MLSVVFLVVCAPVAAVLGLVARRQIARNGERGRGLATTGLIAGSIATGLGVLLVALAAVGGAFSVHAGTEPYLPGSTLASLITERSGGRIQDVNCPDDLAGTVGASTTCTATIDGQPGAVQATTTSSQGIRIQFHIDRVT